MLYLHFAHERKLRCQRHSKYILYMQIKELDPGNVSAGKAVQRLTPIVNERREKMKDEMLGRSQLLPPLSIAAGLLYLLCLGQDALSRILSLGK